MAAIVMLTAAASSAQTTLVERTYIMRADTTTFDPGSGMTHVCVLLYPDGRYRMEHAFRGSQSNEPDVKVYLDTLPEADAKAWQAALDEPKFQEIKTTPPTGDLPKDLDAFQIDVPREHDIQSIAFRTAAERKPFEKELKPVLALMKGVEKRKVPVAKGEKYNNCEPPKILYKKVVSSDAGADQKPQQ